MKRIALLGLMLSLLLAQGVMAATEETKQQAIDDGLAWLAATQTISGAEGYWYNANNGTLAATASAALAFIEEGYLPGDASMYDAVVTRAVTYIFNRATVDNRFGVEYSYERYAEDYDNDGVYNDGNDEAIFFNPGNPARNVYTTGLVAPVVYALGEALGTGTVVGIGSTAVSTKTYAQAMQDIVDWFSWAQVEPSRGIYRGGWRYDANYPNSDNSTAQWGSLPLLYAAAWGLGTPDYVFSELELWVNHVQNANGGSGYTGPNDYVNVAKTGGLLLELAAIGAPMSDTRVQDAIAFINSNWNAGPSGIWYGNFNHPYAMWAVYKGLQVYNMLVPRDCGGFDIAVGNGIANATGGISICSDASPQSSAGDDWYSHYCDYLCTIQNANGSWGGYYHWVGALATGWYINILNAVEVPPPPRVTLDIKPTSCPNPLNTGSMGVNPVALVAEPGFDIMTIDPSTILLEGVAPLMYAYEDVATPFHGELCDCHELGPDGVMDMTIKFKNQDIVAVLIAMADNNLVAKRKAVKGRPGVDGAMEVGPREFVELTLTAETYDGTPIEVSDCVRVMWKVHGAPDGPEVTDKPDDPIVLAGLGVELKDGASRIWYTVPQPTHVSIAVYDVAGRRVRTLVNGVTPAGTHKVVWDGRNDSGFRVASGIYFCNMSALGFEKAAKLIIVE